MESISKQRLELDSPNLNAHDTRFSYQDIIALAKFTVAVKIESVNKVMDMAVSFITKMAKITEPERLKKQAVRRKQNSPCLPTKWALIKMLLDLKKLVL